MNTELSLIQTELRLTLTKVRLMQVEPDQALQIKVLLPWQRNSEDNNFNLETHTCRNTKRQ